MTPFLKARRILKLKENFRIKIKTKFKIDYNFEIHVIFNKNFPSIWGINSNYLKRKVEVN